MSEWTSTDRRIAMWSATGAATIGVIFIVVGLVGVIARPPSSDPLRQVDPYLAILEVLMMLFAVVLVIAMAAVYTCAPLERKTSALDRPSGYYEPLFRLADKPGVDRPAVAAMRSVTLPRLWKSGSSLRINRH